MVGVKASFKVIAKDESGNAVTFGGATIGGYIDGPEKVSMYTHARDIY